MKENILLLNEGWNFTWTSYKGKDRDLLSGSEIREKTWYPATVPGHVQSDLQKLGFEEDPFFANNADHYRWCEEVDFWYRRTLEPINHPKNSRVILHFEGLDCFATIWIDGRKVGQHANMFVPYWIDVTEYLRSDRSVEIMIRLAASFQEVRISHDDPCNHPPMQRIRSRKAQISFGWDIGPRLVTVGIWRPVRLEIIECGRILHAGARTLEISDKSADMELVAAIDWHSAPEIVKVTGKFGPVSIDQTIDLVGGVNDIIIPFKIQNPELWWPKGYGDPHLYDYELTLVDETSRELHRVQGKFGVCKVQMHQEPRQDGGMGFRFTVNNRDYFAKGLNWTPSDAIFARVTDERIRHLVKMTSDLNVNMLRVWGGGVYEPDTFMQACDEQGILVWQDFLFACSLYPQDNEFCNLVKDEVSKIIRAYRGHVCLAAWSGDNEVDLCGPEGGVLISRKVIPSVLNKLDPNRPYVPSSPFSVPGKDPNDPKYGDCHLWDHTIRADDPFYTKSHASFVSEIGRISFPSQKTIDTFMPGAKQWPVTNPLWRYHATDTNHAGVYRNIPQILKGIAAHGYSEPKSLNEIIEITQKIQAEDCRYFIELFGSDPQCWGILLWNLCDCWPQVSDALISYDLEVKPAFWAIKNAYALLKR